MPGRSFAEGLCAAEAGVACSVARRKEHGQWSWALQSAFERGLHIATSHRIATKRMGMGMGGILVKESGWASLENAVHPLRRLSSQPCGRSMPQQLRQRCPKEVAAAAAAAAPPSSITTRSSSQAGRTVRGSWARRGTAARPTMQKSPTSLRSLGGCWGTSRRVLGGSHSLNFLVRGLVGSRFCSHGM
jgi:hypothetical protein